MGNRAHNIFRAVNLFFMILKLEDKWALVLARAACPSQKPKQELGLLPRDRSKIALKGLAPSSLEAQMI